MRNAFVDELCQLAERNPRLVLVVGDHVVAPSDDSVRPATSNHYALLTDCFG